jgi:regulator of RNase E activity RraA
VVVVPRAIAEEVVQATYEQDQRETFIMSRITHGASILGVYPPDADTLRDYEAWKQHQP